MSNRGITSLPALMNLPPYLGLSPCAAARAAGPSRTRSASDFFAAGWAAAARHIPTTRSIPPNHVSRRNLRDAMWAPPYVGQGCSSHEPDATWHAATLGDPAKRSPSLSSYYEY